MGERCIAYGNCTKAENEDKVDIGIKNCKETVNQQQSGILEISHNLSGRKAPPFRSKISFIIVYNRASGKGSWKDYDICHIEFMTGDTWEKDGGRVY